MIAAIQLFELAFLAGVTKQALLTESDITAAIDSLLLVLVTQTAHKLHIDQD